MEPDERTYVRRNAGLLALTLALGVTAGGSLVYLAREHKAARDLAAARDQARIELTQARSQIKTLSDNLAAQETPPPSPPPAPVGMKRARTPSPRPSPAPKRAAQSSAEDKRLSQIQARLADQEKELAGTREEVQKTRSDLQSSLSSTRDELNQSIAKTHEEVVALQRRGELNVYEFQLLKSKNFQRVGPIQVRLRKTNNKHKFYDVSLIVDDNPLDKKHINLFEPVWLTLSDRPRPLELVVNKVGKDLVSGYLTEPKYKTTELAAGSPAVDRPRLP